MLKVNCKICDKEFKVYPSSTAKYCSKECYSKRSKKYIIRVCKTCGNEFKIYPDRIKNLDKKIYCSLKCKKTVKVGKSNITESNDDLKWFAIEDTELTEIGLIKVSTCIKCGNGFSYVSKGTNRRVCDTCRIDKSYQGYGSKDSNVEW